MSEHLNRLAEALTAAGWTAEPRYAEKPARLRVFSPDLPALGDSVSAADGWYVSSLGDPLGRLDDVEAAVLALVEILEPFAAVARIVEAGGTPTEDVLDRARDVVKNVIAPR